MLFVFGAFLALFFSQSPLFSLPLPFLAFLFFFCLMQKESNGQSNCCFSPVIHMEILISLLKESKTGQVKGGGCEHNTGGKEEEDDSKMGSYLLVNTEKFENNCYCSTNFTWFLVCALPWLTIYLNNMWIIWLSVFKLLKKYKDR